MSKAELTEPVHVILSIERALLEFSNGSESACSRHFSLRLSMSVLLGLSLII